MQVKQIKGHIQDIYLAIYADKILLLDGACRCDVEVIVDYITHTLGRDICELKLVLVTHAHPDHVGAAQALRTLTGCALAGTDTSHYWYGGIAGATMFWVDQCLAHWLASKLKRKRKNLLYNPYITFDYLLKDQDSLPFFPDWQVLYTPGHTDRDLSAYHAQTNAVYVADLLVRARKSFIAPFPIYFPDKYRASLARIKNLQPAILYLAHGGEASVSQKEFDSFIQYQTPSRPKTVKLEIQARLKRLILKQRRYYK